MTKLKTYVMTLAKSFPGYHPEKGKPTNFADKFLLGDKTHTMRGNYELWKKRLDQVNEGKAILSLREWKGRPYHKVDGVGQVEIMPILKVGYQKVSIKYAPWPDEDVRPKVFVDDKEISTNHNVMDLMIRKDGFGDNIDNFYNWFPMNFDGILIHFNSFKY